MNGGADNDYLDGGEGDRDVAVFTEEYTIENYPYLQNTDGTITFANDLDGIDTLKNIEWGFFKDTTELLPSTNSEMIARRRVIPLPLTDGVEATEFVEVESTVANPNFNDPPTPPTISLTAPVAMLDGDVDYTLNISPYQPDTEYNVVYVIDTSISIEEVELQTIQDAYTDLTNFYINEGIAENINFGVVSYDSSGRFYTDSSGDINLTADEAIAALQNLTIDIRIGTRYYDGLNRADQTITNLNHLNQTISLNNTYTNPVVFALPLSYNDEEPAIARIHDIESDSFSVYLKEPEYLDDQHADETITYMVIEAGSWQLKDGTILEVGSLDTDKMPIAGWE